MKVSLFDFDLPPDLIALRPLSMREEARLLVVRGLDHQDHKVHDLPDYVEAGDIMVFNDTRVIPARLTGHRGLARIEITLHMKQADAVWKAFARPAKKLKLQDIIIFAGELEAEVLAKGDGGEITVRFNRGGSALREALATAGIMPLPPYIASQRPVDAQDLKDYQTVYGKREGAVAAPTAGLHFTDDLLQRLTAKGVRCLYITLHVGAGTFLPVKVDDTADHKMHAEWGEITPEAAETLNEARAAGHKIVAVGTTSLRLLESAADATGTVRAFSGATDIFITPGYRFRVVDRLMTNFHLPRSTLFMLVSAFAGTKAMRAAYDHSIAAGYRFYSYGDSSLLFREDSL